MGSDSLPFTANLPSCKDKWIRKTKRKAQNFGKIFSFIHDLTVINDGGEFEKAFMEYIFQSLGRKKKNTSPFGASVLDLGITILDGKFILGLYDKSVPFPFSIARIPYMSSNMPSKIFYASL